MESITTSPFKLSSCTCSSKWLISSRFCWRIQRVVRSCGLRRHCNWILRSSSPVRLSPMRVKLTSRSNSPISGGSVPKSGTPEIFIAITRESPSHFTPEKKQCAAPEEALSASRQSISLELRCLTMEAFIFSSTSRSEAWRMEVENRKKKIIKEIKREKEEEIIKEIKREKEEECILSFGRVINGGLA
nr:hypothetical protein Iba_chr04aCG4570 [Ipomoea batatas]